MSIVCNGVDVGRLAGMIEDIKREPARAKVTFRVASQWKGGFEAQHTVSSYTVGSQRLEHDAKHSLRTDEPAAILGKDSGISPAETLLASLASCLSVGYAANAAAMGINIEELRFELTGEGDLQGFMNLGDVRPGLSSVTVKTHIKSDAPQEKIKELHDYVNSHSPIWDSIRNPVKIEARLEAE